MAVESPVWFPVLALVIGFCLKEAGDRFGHRRQAERDRIARAEERRIQMQDRRIAFERETLLRLQDELLRLSRGSAESNFFIEAAVNKGAEWTRVMVPDELSERTRLAQAATTALGVRIRNEALRNQVDAFRKTCADFQMPLSKAGSDATFVRMGTQFEALNQSIGQALRQLDDDDLQSTLKQ